MARAFDITAAANRVQLGPDRKAQTAFTVSNVLERPMRGRLRVVPDDGADPGWFTVAGAETRDFAAGATDQVRVDLVVPAGVAAGSYPFRLDVIAEENPDELSARGQSVHLEVPASEAPKQPFPWWIVAVAVVILGLVGVGIWLATRGGGATAPQLEERSLGEVRTLLSEAGIPLARVWEEAARVAGTVTAQEPKEGEPVGEEGVGVLLGVNDSWVKSRAQLSLNRGESIDLDAGSLNSGAADDLVVRSRNGRMVLEPRNRSRAALVESDELATEARCEQLGFGSEALRLDELPVGAQICVKTQADRFARLRLAEPVQGEEPVEMQYTTWMLESERPNVLVPGVLYEFQAPVEQLDPAARRRLRDNQLQDLLDRRDP